MEVRSGRRRRSSVRVALGRLRPPAGAARRSRAVRALTCAAWVAAIGALSSWCTFVRAAELSVRGPRECADGAELQFRVERAIHMPLSRAARLGFSVGFAREGAVGYTARLSVEAPGGGSERSSERVLTAPSCGELSDAVSVAIALALGADGRATSEAAAAGEPLARRSTRAEVPRPDSNRASAAVAVVSPSEAAADSPPAAASAGEVSASSAAVGASLLMDSGSLPAAGLGVGLSAELRGERLALRASGVLLFEQHVTVDTSGGAGPGADLGLALGSLALCTPVAGGFNAPLVLAVCGGWELGRVEGIGRRVAEPQRGGALWSAPRLDAGVSWAVLGSRSRLVAQLTGATPLKRDEFFLRDLGSLHRAPVVVGRLALGAEATFE